jgi:hypothetical protein
MEELDLTLTEKVICDHSKHREYALRSFDFLKGFEFNEIRCINCHGILRLKISKIESLF